MTKAPEPDKDPNPPSPPSQPAPAVAAPKPAAAAETVADGREIYVVTKLAGPKVAGQRVKTGQKLPLTEAEARSELLAGTIVKEGEQLPTMFTRKGPSKAA